MLLLWFLLLTSVRSQFTNPARFRREKWVVGDVEEIEFDTDLEDFTIAIWQQSLSQGAASKGPVIYQTSDGSSGSFKWPVQAYDFELDDSNVFFLWLFEGSASQQGNTSANQVSSSFFNITSESKTTTSTLIEPTSSSTQPSTSTTPPETTDATTARDDGPDPTRTDGLQSLEPSSPPTTTSTPPDNASGEDNSDGSGELSVAAKAGVGAGVGVVGITCISCTFLLWGYLRKKKAAIAAPQETNPNGMAGYGHWQTPPPYWKAYPLQEIQGSHYGSQNSEPAELGSGRF